MATTGNGSRSFGRSKPFKRHLQRGSGGVQAEVADLRSDVDQSFCDLELSGQLAVYTVDTVAPTITDDESKGHVRFSKWLDTSTGMIYELVDPTAGAAVWHEVTNLGVVPGGLVASVFGRTGVVVAAPGDYDSNQVTNASGVAGATVSDALDALEALAGSSAPVDSVFGRLGVVVATSGDYPASFITNDSAVGGATVAAALDVLNVSKVAAARTLVAGSGLTGGGDLSADRTFNVVANADGSIVANANDVQVGILATDAQHGSRGGGPQHVTATGLVAGFMSAVDKAKLDTVALNATNTALTATPPVNVTKAAAAVGVAVEAARADHKHDVTTAAPSVGVGVSSSEGVATTLARSDHGHALRTTEGGGTDLLLGSVADGELLQRSGTSLVGAVAAVLTGSAPVNVTKAAAVVGVATDAARADHKHDITTAAPAQGIGTGNMEGSATQLARADHGHALRESGGTDLAIGAVADGQVLVRSGASLIGAAPGGAPVDSVFGRTGIVAAQANDYTWAQIDKTTSDLVNLTTRAHASLQSVGVNDHHARDHAASHSSGGVDAVSVLDLGGFPGGTTNFLRADGTFAAPPGAGASPYSSLTFGGGNLSSAGTAARYLEPWHDGGAAGTTEVFIQDWPFACNMSQLRLTWGGSPDPISTDFVLRVNGVDTALAVTEDADALAASNLASTVAVAAGDQVSFVVRKSATLGGALSDLQASIRVEAT